MAASAGKASVAHIAKTCARPGLRRSRLALAVSEMECARRGFASIYTMWYSTPLGVRSWRTATTSSLPNMASAGTARSVIQSKSRLPTIIATWRADGLEASSWGAPRAGRMGGGP